MWWGPASGEGGECLGRTGRPPGAKAPRGLFCQQKGSTRRCRGQHLRTGLAGPHRREEGRGRARAQGQRAVTGQGWVDRADAQEETNVIRLVKLEIEEQSTWAWWWGRRSEAEEAGKATETSGAWITVQCIAGKNLSSPVSDSPQVFSSHRAGSTGSPIHSSTGPGAG